MSICKKREFLTKKFLKILLFIIVAAICLGGICVPGPIEPNPNRKLVLSKSGYSLFNPVWHPNGEWVYYLNAPERWLGGALQICGSVWRVKPDGTDDRQIIANDSFCCLTISHNGEKLAFVKGTYSVPLENNKIILADTTGAIIDTIQSIHSGIRWIKFNSNGDKIYFSIESRTTYPETTSYFRVSLDGSDEEYLFSRAGFNYYFDIFSSDSMYIHPSINVPSIHPQNQSYVVSPSPIGDLMMKNLITGKEDSLDADPFGSPIYIDMPSWSPDGDKVVYCVAPKRGDPLKTQKIELWMVENIEIGWR